jgi:hypothetical protein
MDTFMETTKAGTSFLDALGASLTALLSSGMERLFGRGVYAPVLAKYDITASDNLRARKVYTEIHVLSNALSWP